MKRYKHIIINIISIAVVLLTVSCNPLPEDAQETGKLPDMYPDYTNVTIPKNIAPLNFMVRGNIDAIAVEINGEEIYTDNSNKVEFDIDDWHTLLDKNTGKKLSVRVFTKSGDKWEVGKTFYWEIANDTIDSYLTYRLIEPDYEIWNNLQIQQRNITNFDIKQLGDYNLQENRCMNCHIFGNQDPNLSMMYVRGKGGGAILNRNGKLRKLDIKAKNETDSMISSSVYYGFDPTGRYITFSTNIIIPAFHANPGKRLEVYDSKSDVYYADLDKNIIYKSTLLADTSMLETFPTFSPDGRYIYYCTAHRNSLKTKNLKGLQYALVRIPFRNGHLGNKVDTLLLPNGKGKQSVCHPRISPDGHYIVYTVANYGTFPIWHPEADLQMIDLKTGRIDSLFIVNSNKSDTYHSWSSNSRWLVFASKRDDGLYGKPYFCYIDRKGKAHKPFVLPQKDPEFYDNCLKSFNVPELSKGDVPFNAIDVERIMKNDAEPFILKRTD